MAQIILNLEFDEILPLIKEREHSFPFSHCVSEFFAVTAPNSVGTGNKVSNRPPKEDRIF